MEVTCFSETSLDFQQATPRYVPEDRTLHNHLCENLKSHKPLTVRCTGSPLCTEGKPMLTGHAQDGNTCSQTLVFVIYWYRQWLSNSEAYRRVEL
jgi:hypothetical protein